MVVSHCFEQPFKDFVLSLEHHAGLGTGCETGYWHLSCVRYLHCSLRSAWLATSSDERHVAVLAAMESCDQLLVAARNHQRLLANNPWDPW